MSPLLATVCGSALVLASLVLVPAAANAAVTQTGTIDCDEEQYGEILVAPGDTAQITQTNCVAISGDFSLISPEPVDGVPSATFELSAGASVTLASESGTETRIDVTAADLLDDPAGTLLDTSEIEIAASPAEFSVGEGGGSHDLGDRADCTVQSGDHVYAALPIVITEAGDFTFRAIATSPESENLNGIANSYFPIQDPTLAVYTEFDPSNPDAGVVGCADDRDEDGSLADGTLVDDLFPQFDATLAAGEYTLVLTTYETIGVDSWESGQTGFGEEFAPQAQSSTFQLWGPEGSLDVVVAPAITSPAPTASITVGEAFSYAVTTSGTAPLTFDIGSGTLPAGLTLNTGTGVISGTPTTAGTSAFTVTATNAAGTATSAEYTITVAAPVPVAVAPTITAVDPDEVLVDGTSLVGVTGTGFDENTTVAIDGVEVTAVTIISDTELGFIAPAHAVGDAELTVTTAGRTSVPFTITYIEVPAVVPTITSPSLIAGAIIGTPFTFTVTASGTAPLLFEIGSGALPAGLTLNAETGVISGTPTSAGTSSFTVVVSNAAGTATSPGYAVTVAAAPAAGGTPGVVIVPTTPAIVPTDPVIVPADIPRAATVTRPTPADSLAYTGADASGLALLSGLALAAGVLFTALSRRRRSQSR